MATKTRKASPARATKRSRKEFDPADGNDWHSIPSKGMLFTLAIAAYEGATFPGSEVLGNRDKAKEIIADLKEKGYAQTK